MSTDPVLVIHGVATRDRAAFEAEVAALDEALDLGRPLVSLYWGDLARPADAVDTVVPYGRLIEPDPDAPRLDPDEEPGTALERVVEGWRRWSTATRHRLLASVYQLVRDQYLAASAGFVGDVALSQRHRDEIRARIWQTVIAQVPGGGLPDHPVDVIAHSLGAYLIVDLATSGHPRLHVDHLVSCGSQVSFFHVIGCSPEQVTPHVPGERTVLPTSIGSWRNFWIPLDPWAFLAEPAFELADGSAPVDVEVTGAKEDRIFRHAATHYWSHPTVIAGIREELAR